MTTQTNHNDILEHIFEIVRMIPLGRVTSYGAIAKSIGMKSSARFVGWAMKQAPFYKDLPAHRVVNSQGMLSGRHHFTPPEAMQQLLENEGVKVENNKVINFKQLFWDPQSEIHL